MNLEVFIIIIIIILLEWLFRLSPVITSYGQSAIVLAYRSVGYGMRVGRPGVEAWNTAKPALPQF